jgi:hypothetical protein
LHRHINIDMQTSAALLADHRIHYGPSQYQFGDLWLPTWVDTKHLPLIVFLHGGWWQSAYDLEYAGDFARRSNRLALRSGR